MEAETVMGLSFSTRNLGLAVVRLDQLVDYSSKLHKEKWTLKKREMILTSLVTCIDSHTIRKINLSIPYNHHQTVEFLELLEEIKEMGRERNIEVITYTPKDLFQFIPDSKKKTHKVFMNQLVLLYPELLPYYEKEINNRTKYYYKMFEAIGVATLYLRKIGRWRS